MSNSGKMFEEDFYDSFFTEIAVGTTGKTRKIAKYPELSIDRVYDNMGGLSGVAGYCDFNVYLYPNLYHFELKHITEGSLPFDNITPRQFAGLLAKSEVPGICAGIVVEFGPSAFCLNEVFYMRIVDVLMLKENCGRKSMTRKMFEDYGIRLFAHKKRTRYTFDVFPWLIQIAKDDEKL